MHLLGDLMKGKYVAFKLKTWKSGRRAGSRRSAFQRIIYLKKNCKHFRGVVPWAPELGAVVVTYTRLNTQELLLLLTYAVFCSTE